MILGSYIIHDGTGTTPYFTAPFPRRGLAALFSVQVTHVSGSPTLVVKVEHKNREDIAWAVAGTFDNITATGTPSKDVTGLMEQCRFSFSFSAGAAGNFCHVIIARPSWRPY